MKERPCPATGEADAIVAALGVRLRLPQSQSMSAVGLAGYKTGYQFPRRRQRTSSETRRMFWLAFYEGRPILKWQSSLRALHQQRRRSWLNGKSERQRAEEKRRPAVRRASRSEEH